MKQQKLLAPPGAASMSTVALLLLSLLACQLIPSTAAAAPAADGSLAAPLKLSRNLLQTTIPGAAADPTSTAAGASQDTNTSNSSDSSSKKARVAPVQDPPCCRVVTDLGFNSSLPYVIISTADSSWYRYQGPKVPATMCVCNTPEGDNFQDVSIHIRVRGSSSAQEYAKKSLTVKVLGSGNSSSGGDNSSGDRSTKISFMGFPADSDFVLHGPENDKTLGMRNWLALNLAARMGRYASRTRYFELFLHTAPGPLTLDSYFGVYIAMENAKRSKHRVDVSAMDPAADISGGYIILYENDNVAPDDIIFDSKLTRLTFIMDYPKNQSADFRELRYIQNYINDMERVMVTPGGNISTHLDLPASIDYLLASEVTKNPDGYRGSIKMSKDRQQPIQMGPVWDYNEAFGICCGYPIEGYKANGVSDGVSGGSAITPHGWRFNICQDQARCKVEPQDGISQWYRALWRDEAYRVQSAQRWQALRAGALSDEWFNKEIASVQATINDAAARNFKRWQQRLADPRYPNFPDLFAHEIKYLKDWTLARLAWMDAAFEAQAQPGAGPTAYLAVNPEFKNKYAEAINEVAVESSAATAVPTSAMG